MLLCVRTKNGEASTSCTSRLSVNLEIVPRGSMGVGRFIGVFWRNLAKLSSQSRRPDFMSLKGVEGMDFGVLIAIPRD